MSDGEVADADRPRLALAPQLFERTPTAKTLRHRIVNQIEIDIIQLEAAQAVFECPLGIRVIAIPQLRGNENLLSSDAARADRGADAFLVAVEGRSVDMAIAGLESRQHGGFALLAGRNLPHAQAELRNFPTVVQRELSVDHASSYRLV